MPRPPQTDREQPGPHREPPPADAGPRRNAPPRWRRAFPCAAILLAALLPYARLPNWPLFPDAERAVTRNAAVAGGSIAQVMASDFWGMKRGDATLTGSYRPAVGLTYWLQLRLTGPSPAALHVFDMLLHACGALLVWLVLRRIVPRGPLATGGALLLAAHPAVSEAVCSVVGRADLMAGVAFLAALLVHRGAAGRVWREAAAAALVGIALLSKEYAVVFPVLLVALDVLVPQETAAGSRRRPWGFWLATFGLLGAYLALRWQVLGAIGSVTMVVAEDTPLAGVAFVGRLANAVWLLLPALQLLFVPLALDHVYGIGALPIATGLADPRFLAALVVFAVATLLSGLAWRRRGEAAPLMALGLFALPLLPALNVVGVTVLLFAERFLYVPAVGFALFAAWGLGHAARRAPRLAWGVAVAISLLFGVRTALRVEDWRSNEALARAAVRAHPRSAMAQHELGMMLALGGQFEQAAQHVRLSLDVQDTRPVVWRNYALVLDQLGRRDEAVIAWRRAVEATPAGMAASPEWLRGLAAAEIAAGRPEDAIATLLGALRQHPHNPHLPRLLAAAFTSAIEARREAGVDAEAARLAAQAHDLCDLDADQAFLAGSVLARAGDAARAASAFARAAARDPGLLQRKHAEARALLEAAEPRRAAWTLAGLAAARPGDADIRRDLERALAAAAGSARVPPSP